MTQPLMEQNAVFESLELLSNDYDWGEYIHDAFEKATSMFTKDFKYKLLSKFLQEQCMIF